MLDVNLTTGATGCGKSTLVELICTYLADRQKFGDPRIAWLDTSACIDKSKARKTRSGLLLAPMQAEQDAGTILTAEPVFESVAENITWIPSSGLLITLLQAGSPRTREEAEMYLREYGKDRLHVFHILSTPAQIALAIERRIASGKLRKDDGPGTFTKKLAEYRTKVLPAVKLIPKDILTEIPYEMDLCDKVELYVKNMRIAENIRKKMLQKLFTRNHPIHTAIHAILHPKHATHSATPEASKPTTSIFVQMGQPVLSQPVPIRT